MGPPLPGTLSPTLHTPRSWPGGHGRAGSGSGKWLLECPCLVYAVKCSTPARVKEYPLMRNLCPHAVTATGCWASSRTPGSRKASRVTLADHTWKPNPAPGQPGGSVSTPPFKIGNAPVDAPPTIAPKCPFSMTAGRHQGVPGSAATLRTASRQRLPSVVPEANTPPGAAGFGALTVTRGDSAVRPPVTCAV